jgi:anti-sigma B factor antagonist
MTSFEVVRKDQENVSTLYVKGYLDAHTAPELENALQSLVDENRVQVVVNFSELSYISSAGLGVFMGFIEDIRQAEGDIKLSDMSKKIYRVFDLLGFPTLYEIYDSEAEAVEKFRNS